MKEMGLPVSTKADRLQSELLSAITLSFESDVTISFPVWRLTVATAEDAVEDGDDTSSVTVEIAADGDLGCVCSLFFSL